MRITYVGVGCEQLSTSLLAAICRRAGHEVGLDHMEQHQANLCSVAAQLAEEQQGLDCAGEYEKYIAVEVQADFLGLS